MKTEIYSYEDAKVTMVNKKLGFIGDPLKGTLSKVIVLGTADCIENPKLAVAQRVANSGHHVMRDTINDVRIVSAKVHSGK